MFFSGRGGVSSPLLEKGRRQNFGDSPVVSLCCAGRHNAAGLPDRSPLAVRVS
jgi:hypothetical protein